MSTRKRNRRRQNVLRKLRAEALEARQLLATFDMLEGGVLNEPAPGVLVITPGVDFNADATLDTNSNGRWDDTVGVSGLDLLPDTSPAVTRVTGVSALPGIDAAFELPGGSTGNAGGLLLSNAGTSTARSFQNAPGDWTNGEDVTIEIWFKPDNLTPTPNNGQILFEDGGGTGFGFFVANNELQLRKAGGGAGIVTSNISGIAGEFIQAVGIFDASGPSMELYVNGVSAGTDSGFNNDWSGGDPAGVGTRGGANTGGIGGGQSNTESFDGQISIFRVYRNQVLTPAEIQKNFDAITGVTQVQGSGANVGNATATDQGGSVTMNADGSFSYTPPTTDFAGSDTFTYDAAGGQSTVTINVLATNDAPVNSIPGTQTVAESSPLVFSGANAITVSDLDFADTPGGELAMILEVKEGTLTLGGTAGLQNLTGNGTATVSFTGVPADIDVALDGLSYAQRPLAQGPDTLTITTSDQGNSSVFQMGLQGGWSFDIDGRDTSTNGFDLTLNGAALIDAPATAAPLGGEVLQLTGGNAEAVGYTGVTGTAPRSSSAWIRTTDNDAIIMSWGVNSGGEKWVFRVNDNAGNGTAGAVRLEVSGGFQIGSTVVNDGNWHHVAATWENDGSPNVQDVKLYVDGVLETISGNQSQSINTSAGQNVVIGGEISVGMRDFLGEIDDAGVWDRVLSDLEIAGIYNAGAGRSVAEEVAVDTVTIDIDNAPIVKDDDYVTPEATTLNVGAAGVLSNDLAVIVPGATLTYDAGLESDNVWNGNGTAADDFSLGAAPVNVSSSRPGISKAYQFDGTGGAENRGLNDLAGDPSDASATWEFWFRPDDMGVGNDRDIIYETGGGGDGMSIVYDRATGDVRFTIDDGSNQVTVSGGSSLIGFNDFNQLAAVYEQNAAGNNDRLALYINGNLVQEDTGSTGINDWDGGDTAGLGEQGANGLAQTTGTTQNYKGDLAIFRFYEQALTGDEVVGNFVAIAGTTPAVGQDADGQSLTFTQINGTAYAAGDVFTLPSGADVTIQADGSLTYVPAVGVDPGAIFADTFTYTLSDGALTSTATVTVTVQGINDAPVISVPGAQSTTEGTAVTFSGANAITIADSDVAAAGELAVTLAAGQGTLTLGSTLNLNNLQGNGTSTVSFTGIPADIDAALNGLVYAPNADALGPDTLTVSTSDQAFSSVLTSGLQGAWQFNGNANDSTPHGRDAALNGGASFAAGQFDEALSLDGAGDYVTVTGYTGVTGAAARTMSAWINTSNGGDEGIMSWGNNSTSDKWVWRMANGHLRVEVNGGGVESTVSVDDGSWHHVAVVYDGSGDLGGVEFYVDGVHDPKSVTANTAITTAAGADVVIGADRVTNTTRDFNGSLDDAAIWDRALSAEELALIYNGGAGRTVGALTDTATIAIEIDNAPQAEDDDYGTITEEDTLSIAAPGLFVNDPPFTTDASLNYVASDDDGANATWENTGSTGGFNINGLSGVTHNPAPATSFPGITATYDFDGTGGGNLATLNGQGDNAAVTLETWIRPADLTGDEFIFETGGGNGFGIYLGGGNDATYAGIADSAILLSASNNANNRVAVAYDLATDLHHVLPAPGDLSEFIQVVAVLDPSTDVLELYLNGQFVADNQGNGHPAPGLQTDANTGNLSDWSGGDNAGIGTRGQNNAGGIGGGSSGYSNYAGQMAIFRLYGSALSAAEVRNNFEVIAVNRGQDIDGTSLTFTQINGMPYTAGDVFALPSGAEVTISADGSLSYDPTVGMDPGEVRNEAFTYTVSDGVLSATANVTVTVLGVNDAPVISVPLAQTVDEGSTLVFSGANAITIADSDVAAAAGGELVVTMSVKQGTLTLAGTANLSNVTGDGTSSLGFQGLPADIDNALDGLVYTPDAFSLGPDTVTITTSDQAFASTFTPGLQGAWQFNGDASDSTPNGRDGSLNGGASFAAGQFDEAISLDGAGDYVTVTGYKGVTGADARTMSAWINTSNGGDEGIMSWGNNSASDKWVWRMANGHLRVEVNGGGVESTVSVDDGSWHHVAVVYDGSGNLGGVEFYVDGVHDPKSVTANTAITTAAGADVVIGADRVTNTTRDFNGSIDDAAIWDRALTAEELAAIYHSGTGRTVGELTDNNSLVIEIDNIPSATDDDYGTITEDDLLTVAAPGVLVNDPPFTTGASLNYVASDDDGANATWENTGSTAGFNITGLSGVSFNPAPAMSFPGITASYDFDGTGGGDLATLNGQGDGAAVTLETWIRPADLSGDEYIFETGGGNGFGIYLGGGNNATYSGIADSAILVSASNNANNRVAVAYDLAVDPRGVLPAAGDISKFIQVVAVLDPGTDLLELYLNGQFVADNQGNGHPAPGLLGNANTGNLTDWSGGDNAGIGTRGQNNAGGIGGGSSGYSNYEGQMGIFRLYGSALTATEVRNNFETIAVNRGEDIDGTTLTFTQINGMAYTAGDVFTLPAGAEVTIAADGSLQYDPAGLTTLNAGDAHSESFTYTVSDGSLSATATVSVTVLGLNDAPVATDNGYDVDEDDGSAGVGNVISDDTGDGVDSDPDTGDTIASVVAVNGDAANVGTQVTLGSGILANIASTGAIDVDPNGQFESLGVGDTAADTLTYTILETNQLTTGLEGFWRFDDAAGASSAVDASGNGRNGTLTGGLSTGNPVAGQVRTAIDFDATTDHVEVSGYKGVTGSAERSMVAWVKFEGTNPNQGIMHWGTNSTGQKWTFRVQDSNGTAGAIRVEVNGAAIVGSTDIRDGQWHHVAAVFEPGSVSGGATIQDIRLYVDGELETVSAFAGNQNLAIDTAVANDVRIGLDEGTRDWEGLIDEPAIWSRVVTAGEIAAMYASGLNGDSIRQTGTGTVTLTVHGENDAPTVAADSASVTGSEGVMTSHTGTFNDIDASDNVTITASVGTVTQTGTNSGTWMWSYTPADGPSSETITITATDAGGLTAMTSFTLNVNNVPPSGSISGPSKGSPAETLPFTFTGTDVPDDLADLDCTVDWGDGMTDPLGNCSTSVLATHEYGGLGNFTISLLISDDEVVDHVAATRVVEITNDPRVDSAGNLVVPDSLEGSNEIIITDTIGGGQFVRRNNVSYGPFYPTSGIVRVITGDGPDRVLIASSRICGDIDVGGGDNYVAGSGCADTIVAGGGDDIIISGRGNDIIDAGDGENRVDGGDGDDVITAGSGRDELLGNDGDDIIHAGGGVDAVAGGTGDDLLYGGDGNDTLSGGDGNDVVLGEAGDDRLFGRQGADIVLGGTGADAVHGNEGSDVVGGGVLDLTDSQWLDLRDEWASGEDFDQRVNHVLTGAHLANGNQLTALMDDVGLDGLTGGVGRDLFLPHGTDQSFGIRAEDSFTFL